VKLQLVVAGRVLRPPLSIGRTAGNDLELDSGKVARQHCLIWFDGEQTLIEDLGSSNGTWVNGQRIRRQQLAAGDRVQLPDGSELEVRAVDAPSWLELSKAVEQDPTDDQRWRVFADALLEIGDPLGERIARSQSSVDDLLAREVADGNLQCEWRHGFMRSAVLRRCDGWWDWSFTLQRLVDHPLAHFLEELEVDVASLRHDVNAIVKQVTAARLPVLRRLRIGPYPREAWVPSVSEETWEACLAAHPRLDRADPIWREGRAFIGTTHLDPEMNTVIAPDVIVTREHDAWWMIDRMKLQQRLDGQRHVPLVNGRRSVKHRLRPGDEIEAEPGVKQRFHYIQE
jgi:hypothetical protein